MEVIYPRCAGLDVHEAFVVVCCRILGPDDGHLDKVVRRYSTMTADLLALGDWLAERVINRIHKVLEDANIKLTAVASDIMGVSGRAMLQALATGETDPQRLAQLARHTLRKRSPNSRRRCAVTCARITGSCCRRCSRR
jgi:hypothetical protein